MFTKLNLKNFWYTNLISIITLAVGALLTAKPDIITTVCKFVGRLGILAGIILLILYAIPKTCTPEKRSYGILFLVAGLLLCLIPALLKFLIPVLFGGWILTSSISGMYRNFSFRHHVSNWQIGFILCTLSAILSIYIITRPITAMNETVKIIGIGCMIHAVLRIVSSVLGRNGYKAAEEEYIDTTLEE